MYSRCDYLLFVYFLILPSLLNSSILFNYFYTCNSWIYLLRCTPLQLHLRLDPDMKYLSPGIYQGHSPQACSQSHYSSHHTLQLRLYCSHTEREGLGDQLYV